jgi:hypothetical protein
MTYFHIRSWSMTALLALGTSLSGTANAHPPFQMVQTAANFEQDRADILAMAGNYRVSFNMQESTRWDPNYEVLEPKRSGGNEVVRVIEDTGRRISLQHMLVMTDDAGKSHIIKHWRQDWEFEPAKVLVYSDRNHWTWQDVPAARRSGSWSQTVWQVDDSPRYGSWGAFQTQGGVRRWRSDWTWRPLARRDAVRNPAYDRYYSINRHQPSPDGWIHWQDNIKLGLKDGKLVPIVQEYVLNNYIKYDQYDTKAADAYWASTKDYWAAVRAEWDRVAKAKGGIAITEQADTGTVISARLLEMGDDIHDKKLTTAAAITEAKRLIDGNTKAL